jgi:hypothetical protein
VGLNSLKSLNLTIMDILTTQIRFFFLNSPFFKEPDFYKFGMIWHHFNEFSQFSSLK